MEWRAAHTAGTPSSFLRRDERNELPHNRKKDQPRGKGRVGGLLLRTGDTPAATRASNQGLRTHHDGSAPKGRPTSAQGNALGINEQSQPQALKGRATLSPLQGSRVELD